MYSNKINKFVNSKENLKNIINRENYQNEIQEKIIIIESVAKNNTKKTLKINSTPTIMLTKKMKSKTVQNQLLDINLGFNTAIEAEDFYYTTITKNTIKCDTSQRLGSSNDGGWDVCFMGNYKLKTPCLSYSFGVNYIWEFDDTVAQTYGCVVRTFDPSMKNEPNELQRPSKVFFYKIGLTKEDTTWPSGWTMMKMSSILKKFNEQDTVIDILKIDIEFSEWDSFESMFKEGILKKVKQLMFETHTEELQGRTTTKENYVRFLRVWNGIYEAGFRQWKNNWNNFGRYESKNSWKQRTCCFEHYLININYL